MKKLLLLTLFPLFIACKKDSNLTPDPVKTIAGRWYVRRILQEEYQYGKVVYQSDSAVNGTLYYEFNMDLTGMGSTTASGRRFMYETDGKTITLRYDVLNVEPATYNIKSLTKTEMHFSRQWGSTDYGGTEDVWLYR